MKLAFPDHINEISTDVLSLELTKSKSISNRVLTIQALRDTSIKLEDLASAEDTKTLYALVQNYETKNEINIGHAGTAMRFGLAFLALKAKHSTVLTGSERMQERPIGILVEKLLELGADIEYLGKEGFPPLLIKPSALNGGKINIKGSVSSQYISALLLIAPYLKNGLEINIDDKLTSVPYVNMTLSVMKIYGAQFTFDNNWNFIKVKEGKYYDTNHQVEADWSAASYWYNFVALAKKSILLKGLKENSFQGDQRLVAIYKLLGVSTEFNGSGAFLSYNGEVAENLVLDLSDCPDIAQSIAVICAALGVACRLSGLKTLVIKETNRLVAIRNELEKFGVKVSLENDEVLSIVKQNILPPNARILTYQDHRMAMAFAVLCVLFPIEIENQDVVSKSYPEFWKDLSRYGVITL